MDKNFTNLFFFQYQISFFKSITFQVYSRGKTGTRVQTENHKKITKPIQETLYAFSLQLVRCMASSGVHTPDSIFTWAQHNDGW